MFDGPSSRRLDPHSDIEIETTHMLIMSYRSLHRASKSRELDDRGLSIRLQSTCVAVQINE